MPPFMPPVIETADDAPHHAPSQAAALWCLAVQECALHHSWPRSVYLQWPSETEHGSQRLIFAGPRLRMGLAEGVPGSIRPDPMGRAEYAGTVSDLATKLMEAGEWVIYQDGSSFIKSGSSISKMEAALAVY